jgi:hydrogenase maturation protease
MTVTRLVVLAWGNDSRGDDAIGPRFVANAGARPDPPGVITTYVEDYQLQPEHAIDLDGADLVLFVDASREAVTPHAFREIEPARNATFTTHGVAPGVVLDAYRCTFRRPPPPAFELAIRGDRFELGARIGARARRNLEAALALFSLLRRHPSAEAWRVVADQSADTPARHCEEPCPPRFELAASRDHPRQTRRARAKSCGASLR